RDDAAGEAFDKTARTLGLGYPGGPIIDQLAQKGNPQAIDFPRAYLDSLDFSFSGLKSSVINYCHKLKQQGKPIPQEDVAASFQAAVIEVLVEKTRQAAQQHEIKTIVLAGGVAANQGLRKGLQQMCQAENWQFSCPPVILCTDNAAMIGCAAYYKYLKQAFAPLTLNALPGLKIGQELYSRN
ncbi:MAG: tRNA (adenosine(37)-N6)-threonylcarbamoyltransferase complex transferase subunit TsaD, partial [Clostridia bacterium]|nr:tRNA (adenosine(37)-N6)-threonylcarbamoyltransferase complex transferase subunit TsaD [Clostridia bacterium]